MLSGAFSATPVLSLAPDSIASLGDLDATSLSDLWGGESLLSSSCLPGEAHESPERWALVPG